MSLGLLADFMFKASMDDVDDVCNSCRGWSVGCGWLWLICMGSFEQQTEKPIYSAGLLKLLV
eukprot:scaffold112850_cov17-Tisochrysis_lutea.AAC.1